MTLSRRSILALLAAAGAAGSGVAHAQSGALEKSEGRPFSRDWLLLEAQRLAGAPYRPLPQVPAGWRDLTYDQYRKIWFNSQKALWSSTRRPFRVDFFHPGLYFPRPVEISIVERGEARKLAFDIDLFDRTDQFPDLPIDETMGYSGFRLRAELERPEIFTEFMVFQGASYFRAIGAGQNYGLSARGLALDTAEDRGEEFPEFTRFWVDTPEPGDRMVKVHALLDGPSTTGAYHFSIMPGPQTIVDVEATLFPRRALAHVGLGPLTSMFLFDETNRTRFDDFRPAVHDSDGLMVWNGAGELLWRPLANPRKLQVSSFVDDGPRGFGLMQRARDVEDFADLEAHYERRPCLWVVPGEDWGQGAVTLVEIPAEKEIYDNIVAYWRPRAPLPPRAPHRFTYQMIWGEEPPRPRDVARILNTRIGKGFDKTQPYMIVTVDFAPHPALDGDMDGIVRHISSNRGAVSDGVLQRNPGTGGWRLAFKFDPEGGEAAELRAQLVKDGKSLTEVWLYRWTA
ncbi:MAG: glucan biosynthesis protein G [Pseudomonadota bacterium]